MFLKVQLFVEYKVHMNVKDKIEDIKETSYFRVFLPDPSGILVSSSVIETFIGHK